MTVATEPTSQTFEEASAVSSETYLGGDSSDSQDDGIPTIELSSSAAAVEEQFDVQTIEICSKHHDDDLPETATTAITVAELVADRTVNNDKDNNNNYDDDDDANKSDDDDDLESGRRRRRRRLHVSNNLGKRAEFVSATFIKDNPETPLGLFLNKHTKEISSIVVGGLASGSPLQIGDKIYSINKKQCTDMSSTAITKYLRSIAGRVTIVVHNKCGCATIVESMVSKEHIKERSGLVLKRVGRNSRLVVSNVREGLVFVDSLLNIGDEVLTINGISCYHLSPVEAAQIIRQTPKLVTVVARSLPETGVVVAELSTRDILSSTPVPDPACLQDSAAAAQRRRIGATNTGGGRASPCREYSLERAACLIFTAMGIIVIVAFLIASSLRSRNGDDLYYTEDDMEDLLSQHNNFTHHGDFTTNLTGDGCDFWGSDCNDMP